MAVDFKLIGEEQSAELAGVSLSTIQQYRQFGLLEAILKNDQVFYKEVDIKTLFYTTKDGSTGPKVTSDAETGYLPLSNEEAKSKAETEHHQARVIPLPTLDDLVKESAPKQEQEQTEISASEEKITGDKKDTGPSVSAAEKQEDVAVETETPAAEPVASTPQPGTYELLEVNRSLQEQVQMLREERDWLRQRIEKLESRSEREQMLLLAGSETVRNLVNSEKQKKPLWNFALPWFGWSGKHENR
jgi:hypothetical protein